MIISYILILSFGGVSLVKKLFIPLRGRVRASHFRESAALGEENTVMELSTVVIGNLERFYA